MDYKKSLNSDLFIIMAKSALIERYVNEVNCIKTELVEESFSKDFSKKVKRIVHKVGRRERIKGMGNLIAKSLVITFAIMGITFGVLLTQTNVYAAVRDVVKSVFEDHDSYNSVSNADRTEKVFDSSIFPRYIPSEYSLRQVFYGDLDVSVIYENDNGEDIRYSYGDKNSAQISINNERAEISEEIYNDITYYVYQSTIPDEYNTVIWYYDNYYFVLKSQLYLDELVKIAESILGVQ